MIHCAIVDDEPLARDGIHLLIQNDPEVTIVGEYGSGTEALSALETKHVDLLFLDIQMPGMTGFDLLERLPRNRRPVIVFVTAYDQYALKAFKHHALNYLLKPYSDKEFFDVLSQAKRHISLKTLEPLKDVLDALIAELRQNKGTEKGKSRYIQRLAVTAKGSIVPVNVNEIDWFEAADYYVNIHTGSQSYLIRESLSQLEKNLDPTTFVRIHRSTVVRVSAIREIRQGLGTNSWVILYNNVKLKLGKSHKHKLRSFLHFPS